MAQTEPPINGAMRESLPVAKVRRFLVGARDALLPGRCFACGEIVADAGGLCGACWEGVRFISSPQCARCGRPFELELDADVHAGDGLICGDCARKAPVYDQARAAMVYDEASRPVILAFKHGDRTDMAPVLADWLARAGAEVLAEADLIVPVPLHWTRLWSRRFNQSAELARHLAKASGKTYAPGLIRRHRRTPPQAGLGAKARAKNMRGAFSVSKGKAAQISGRRVLLIDDVMTTGSTLNACAGVLLWAGAEGVDVLTLARVVRAERE